MHKDNSRNYIDSLNFKLWNYIQYKTKYLLAISQNTSLLGEIIVTTEEMFLLIFG